MENFNTEKYKTIGLFIFVFIVGFGSGLMALRSSLIQANYNNTSISSNSTTNQTGLKEENLNTCIIKGNSNSRIYHVAGGQHYDSLTSPVCFNNEDEALAAGYRKSSR